MPAHAYWQGQFRLALVSIPIQVFTATKGAARVAFNQIHKPSGKRIRYEKVVPGVGTVNPDGSSRGYEVEKGQYVPPRRREIEDVKLGTKHHRPRQFVGEDGVDPIYFESVLRDAR
jgi:DNA end-binding protein Ku